MSDARYVHRHVSRWVVTIPWGNGMEPDPCALCGDPKALWVLVIRVTGRKLSQQLEPEKRVPVCDACATSIDERQW